MKRKIFVKLLALAALMTLSANLSPNKVPLQTEADLPVIVYLVLGEGGSIDGHTAEDNEFLYHKNVVTFIEQAGQALPVPVHEEESISFVSWVYPQNGTLIPVSTVPLTTRVFYAHWEGDGTLATGDAPYVPPEPGEGVTLYLDVNIWNVSEPAFYVYTFNAETSGGWPGVRMNHVTGNIFTATVNSGFTELVFSRYQSPGGELWDQTENLNKPAGSNLFTIQTWDGGAEGKSSGSWSTYTP
jgi:hypothetical protein